MARTAASPIERFGVHVEYGDAHDRWTGRPDPRTGTGQFRLNGKLRSAQRAAWELLVGPLPAGVRVLACPEDPLCVRVEHLRLEASERRIAPTSATGLESKHHMTVASAFPIYLARLRRHGRSDATVCVYRSVYNRWLDRRLGRLRLDLLTPERIESAITSMKTQVPKSADVGKSILYGLRRWAEEEEI